MLVPVGTSPTRRPRHLTGSGQHDSGPVVSTLAALWLCEYKADTRGHFTRRLAFSVGSAPRSRGRMAMPGKDSNLERVPRASRASARAGRVRLPLALYSLLAGFFAVGAGTVVANVLIGRGSLTQWLVMVAVTTALVAAATRWAEPTVSWFTRPIRAGGHGHGDARHGAEAGSNAAGRPDAVAGLSAAPDRLAPDLVADRFDLDPPDAVGDRQDPLASGPGGRSVSSRRVAVGGVGGRRRGRRS